MPDHLAPFLMALLLMLPPAARALDFATYLHLQEGMTQAELMARAGPPDQMYVEGVRNDEYAWQSPWANRRGGLSIGSGVQQEAIAAVYDPSPGAPYITIVHLVGGRIASIERIRQF